MNAYTNPLNVHLNTAQLDALLAAEPDRAAQTHLQPHLDQCSNCREEFEALRASLTGFRLAATDIALFHHPALKPSYRPIVNPLRAKLLPFHPAQWAYGMATAAVVLGVSLAATHRPSPAANPVVTRAAGAASPLKSQTVSDEALLEDVDRDLSNSVPTSLQPLEANAATEVSRASGGASSQN
jgi:predicted anti-sigma-YlaC factor YlaD